MRSMSEREFGKLHGWEKFFYNVYMILTFPVRKWWIILGVLATVLLVLIIIPTIEGVKKEDIVDWYKAKLTHSDVNKAKNKTLAVLGKKIDNLKDNVKQILPDNEKADAQDGKKESKFVAWNVAEFKKAKYVPNTSSKAKSTQKVYDGNTYSLIKAQMKKSKPEDKADKLIISTEPPTYRDVTPYYEVRTDLNLEYLSEPEIISGTATVAGANELYIGETFVYLYGIYTSPRKYDINEARAFLENVTENQEIECDIIAYSTQNYAKTALCFVNGVLINKEMVIENLADNVALKTE